MSKISLILILLINSFSLLKINAQTQEIDSLEILIQQHESEDTLKVILLNKTASKLFRKDNKKALEYVKKSNSLAQKLNYRKGEAQSLKLIGIYYYFISDYTTAIEYYKKALKIFEDLDNKIGVSSCLNNFGIIYKIKGDYAKALEYYEKSLKVYEEFDNKKGMSKLYNNIGNINMLKGDYPKALEYFKKSLLIKEELDDKKGMSKSYNNIGSIYNFEGNYPKALEYFLKALELYEELDDKIGVPISYNNIGVFYKSQGDYQKALEYHQKALVIREKHNDKTGVAKSYNSIGMIYKSQGNYSMALEYLQKSLIIREELGDKSGIAICFLNIGIVYKLQGYYTKALEFLNKSLVISKELKSKPKEIENYIELSSLYLIQKKTDKAYYYSKKAYEIAVAIGETDFIKESTKILAKSCELLGNYKEAYKYYVVFKTMNDSLYNEKNVKKIAGIEYQYKYDKEKQAANLKQQKKDALRAEKEKQQKIIRNSFIVGFILVSLVVLVLFISYVQKRKANKLLRFQKDEILMKNEELTQQKEEINVINENLTRQNEKIISQKDEIELQRNIALEQKDQIEIQNKSITDSIIYAKRIQSAVLPPQKDITELLPDNFIFYKPKDIVSGDFYWIKQVNQLTVLVAADCTGHGIPGAFMSMLGISFLNEIVQRREITQANIILNELRTQIKHSLRQYGQIDESKDGIDMALCVIDTNNNKMQYAGAHNPLYLIRGKSEKPKLTEIKADKMPVGFFVGQEKQFTNHEIQLEEGDIFYMFSDGFIDQYRGRDNMKYMSKNFKSLLLEIYKYPMQKQKEILDNTFMNWMDKNDQMDDVLVVGVRINN